MYPEFWLKNWSIPSTDSAVKLQELVRLGYEHAVARAEASARMARSLSACRTPFDAIAVYQDWIVAESQRIVGDMRRMAELSKALLESSSQALSSPTTPPMIAAADAMIQTKESPAGEKAAAATAPAAPKEPVKAEEPKPAAVPEPKPAAVPEPKVEPEATIKPAAEPTVAPAPMPTPTIDPVVLPAAESKPAAPVAAVPVAAAAVVETGGETEESKPRRKRKPAAAE